jgi:DNA-binding LacI/PurR family transcriptional regulator
VIGFDDIELASYVGPTTIRQPLFESGLRGGRAPRGDLQRHPPEARSETLPLELVVRGTTGPPAGGSTEEAALRRRRRPQG